MGHCTVLVIGENAQDQLDKFQRAEYAHPTQNRHFVALDKLQDAKDRFARDTVRLLRHTDGSLHDPWDAQFWRPVEPDEPHAPTGGEGRVVTRIDSPTRHMRQYVPAGFTAVEVPIQESMSFLDWVKKRYVVYELPAGQEPDYAQVHRNGWFRLDAQGAIVELRERTIPGGEWDYFENTMDCLKLRADGSLVGVARKDAIDFEGMGEAAATQAAALWDQAAAARGSQGWEPLGTFRDKYKDVPYTPADPAMREYMAQPAVAAMYAAGCWRGEASLDAFLDSRDRFLQRARSWAVFGEYNYVLHDGQMVYGGRSRSSGTIHGLNALLERLPGDTLFTAACVHA